MISTFGCKSHSPLTRKPASSPDLPPPAPAQVLAAYLHTPGQQSPPLGRGRSLSRYSEVASPFFNILSLLKIDYIVPPDNTLVKQLLGVSPRVLVCSRVSRRV